MFNDRYYLLGNIDDWVKVMAAELKKKYGSIEVKRNGNSYYLYKVSSVYDREKKRARKVSGEHLGKLTRNGLNPKRRIVSSNIFEYGNARFLWNYMQEFVDGLKEFSLIHGRRSWRYR
ncbi:MAG: hypothetical protein QXQ46_03700 [Thermoplasmatales archaeon]